MFAKGGMAGNGALHNDTGTARRFFQSFFPDDMSAAEQISLPLSRTREPVGTLYLGDSLEVLRSLPDCSVDAVVTDPPAGIAFMGKEWDKDKGGRDAWIKWLGEILAECHRVMKPGAHALVWALPRTSHWTALAIEDAGLEIRDSIQHIFGSGFPKSLDVSKAIDRAAGATREVVGKRPIAYPDSPSGYTSTSANSTARGGGMFNPVTGEVEHGRDITAPATDAAKQWEGWGTALKPSYENWWLARKPLEGTVAENVLKHGTGGINIGATRIATGDHLGRELSQQSKTSPVAMQASPNGAGSVSDAWKQGRWPANVILSHSPGCLEVGTRRVKGSAPQGRPSAGAVKPDAVTYGRFETFGPSANYGGKDGTETVAAWECVESCAVRILDSQSGTLKSGARRSDLPSKTGYTGKGYWLENPGCEASEGGASRFFATFPADDAPSFIYQAKASRSERERGCSDAHEMIEVSWLFPEQEETDDLWASEDQRVLLRVVTDKSPLRVIVGSGTHPSAAAEWSTFLFGSSTEDRSLQGCRFTIETETSSITESKTLSLLHRSLTNGNIQDARSKTANGSSPAESAEPSSPSLTITFDATAYLPGVGDVLSGTQLRIRKSGGPLATHPTIKPIALMRYLVRMVTPPGGVCLDPFMGSGSTGCAAVLEGFDFIGIEKEPEYHEIARARISHWKQKGA